MGDSKEELGPNENQARPDLKRTRTTKLSNSKTKISEMGESK